MPIIVLLLCFRRYYDEQTDRQTDRPMKEWTDKSEGQTNEQSSINMLSILEALNFHLNRTLMLR